MTAASLGGCGSSSAVGSVSIRLSSSSVAAAMASTACSVVPSARPHGESECPIYSPRLPARSYRTKHRGAKGVGRTTAPHPPPRQSDVREVTAPCTMANEPPAQRACAWKGSEPEAPP